MAAAQSIGIERLANLDTIYIESLRTFVDNVFRTDYKTDYIVHSKDHAVLFYLIEELFDYSKVPFREREPFILDGVDETGNEVFWMRRVDCRAWEQFDLYADDVLLNVVRHKMVFLLFKKHRFHIDDIDGELMLKVMQKHRYSNSSFLLKTKFKNIIGSIDKVTYQSDVELLPYLDGFVVRFPADLDVQLKLAVIVACRLIDLVFFMT